MSVHISETTTLRVRKDLIGSVLRYDDPFEPVAVEDWEIQP
jgi:hypothetical protein